MIASTSTIDIAAVLKPISGVKPCGVDPRDGTAFEVLKEARREEDAASQGDWKRDVKIADWPKAIETATRILSSEGKELQVATWLLEGLVRRHGAAGLRDGLIILRELHERFWDCFYPPIEDGDLEFRSGRLDALNKTLPIAILSMPLILPSGGSPLSCSHYKECQKVENLRRGAATDAKKKQELDEALQEGKLEGDKFEKAVGATPLLHCSTVLQYLNQSWDELEKLEQALDQKYQPEPPSLLLIREALGECRSLMDGIVRKKGGIGAPVVHHSDQAQGEVEMAPVVPTAGTPTGIMPIDRADALGRLAAVAEFFLRTEPHSPVAYLVQRAARWGHMPLEEWLKEVIKKEDVLGDVRETLGLNQQEGQDT